MAYTYRNKAVKGINQNVTASSGASSAQQHASNYNQQIKNTPSYNGGAYANRINQIADDILNNRKNYSFGGEQAMSQFAMDYSALSGLGVAGAKADTDRLTGGYVNSGSQAIADQYRNNYVNPLEQMEITQNIGQTGKQNQLDAGGMLNNANDTALAQYQDRMNSLMNGRDLAESAYQSIYGNDIDMANARQNALNELMGIESDLNYSKDNLKQSKLEADQDYELAKLALIASASKSSGGGSRGGRSRGSRSKKSSSSFNSSWLTDDTSSAKSKKDDVESIDLIPKKELLALGYGPISSKELEKLIKKGDVAVSQDKNGNLHVERLTAAKSPSRLMFGRDNLAGVQKKNKVGLPLNITTMKDNGKVQTQIANFAGSSVSKGERRTKKAAKKAEKEKKKANKSK